MAFVFLSSLLVCFLNFLIFRSNLVPYVPRYKAKEVVTKKKKKWSTVFNLGLSSDIDDLGIAISKLDAEIRKDHKGQLN